MAAKQQPKRLFLLDGMALVYRAHFAFLRNPVMTSDGRNASALFGFTNTLLELIEKQNPTHLAVAFDTSAPTTRHQRYPEYKANRDDMPEDLSAAIPEVKKLVAGFRIPILEVDGFEADDLIGTLATRAGKEGFEVWMVTPDKDFAQLVNENVRMYKPGLRGSGAEILGVEEVCEQWGVDDPVKVADILGLWGDASDNIPGVPGVGEKTAKKLMAQFGSMKAILAGTDQLKGKQKENLETYADQALLSKELATIILDAPVAATWEELELSPERDEEALSALLGEFEFNTLGKRILGKDFRVADHGAGGRAGEPPKQIETIETVDHDYHRFTEPKARQLLLKLLNKVDRWCFDLETDGLDPLKAKIQGIAFSVKPHEAFYCEFPEDPAANKAVLEEFREVFETPGKVKIGHNLKFDIAVLAANGVEVEGPYYDTMIVHALQESEPDQRHGMDHLSKTWLHYQPISFSEVSGDTGEEQLDLLGAAGAGPEKFAEYAAEDADVTFQLSEALAGGLKEAEMEQLYETVEAPLIPVLARIENAGIRLDEAALQSADKVFTGRIVELEESIQEEAGIKFNLASPKQMGKVLFEVLELDDKPKKTKTGQYVTNEQVLNLLAVEHSIVRDILEYRQVSKLKSTYVDALPLAVSKVDGRIHTSFHQLVTATGRLASSNPNLQNIPIRTENGREIRRAFVPRDDDHVLVSADYSQIELRIMAHLSGDAAMLEAFQEGKDVHLATAAKVNGVPESGVSREMRSAAKMVNFGIMYGISPFGLSQRLRIPRREAGDLIDEYFKQYPKIQKFIENTIAEAGEKGWVGTIGGRRRPLRDINSRNGTTRSRAERFAVNTPIQGSAADMIKLAMIRTDRALRERELGAQLVLQVHDELVLDVPKSELEEVRALVIEAMEGAMPLGEVPVLVECGHGGNWLEAH